MGLLDRIGLGRRTSDLLTSGIATPFSDNTLERVTVAGLFSDVDMNVDALPLQRSQAIAIPVVSKARNLLISTIGRFPLRALNADGPLAPADQPSFLYRSDTAVNPHGRIAWTIDDLVFYGCSVWAVKRGDVTNGRRPILDAAWVPQSQWRIDNGRMVIDGTVVKDEDFILFDSPFEGLLNIGNRTLRGARDTEASWVGRARNPIPLIELHQTDDSLTEEQVAPFVEAFSKARRSENGAIGYTPEGIEIRVHGTVAADLMVEGRNAIRTDIGSFLNIRASMLDGTAGVDSLTYSTTEGEKNSFYEFDLPFWTDPIEQRLSMDDIVPRGTRIRFDKYDAYNPSSPTGPIVED